MNKRIPRVYFYFVLETVLFFFTIFSNLNNINSSIRVFIYIFPFIIFYEGLYFHDKEFNYAQIVKIAIFTLISKNINCNIYFVFSLCVWIYSLLQYNWISKQDFSIDWKQNKKSKNYYITIFLNVVVLIFLACSYRTFFQHTITDERISNITSWVITFISTDLIFNFTAMFILLQENYSKYNSVFLLKNIVGYKTIAPVTIISGSMIIMLCLGIVSPAYFISFAVFCIVYCLFCSVSLLQKLKRVLTDTELLNLLIAKTPEQMFYWYKTSQLTASENNIDTILRIATNAIVNKQTDTLPDVLGIVLVWLDDNKDFISDKHHTAYSNNRFYYFMNVITDSLISANSSIIVMLYAEQLFEIFKNDLEKNPFDNKEVDFKNRIKDLHLFYYSLYRLIKHYLSANDKEFDEILLRLTGVLGFNVEKNFLTLEPSKRNGLYVYESDDYRDFEFNYFEFYEKLVDTAIKAENFKYLKHISLFTRFFRFEDAELNTNHLQLLHKLTYIYSEILRACNYRDEILFNVLREYKKLLHYLSYLRINVTLSELIGNVTYNSVKDIYLQLLKNKVLFTERHLELLYELYFDKNKCLNKDEAYLGLFCYVVASYLSYGDIEKEKFAINKIWSRFLQLEELFTKRNQFRLLNIIKVKKTEILSKHPDVQTNYDSYMQILDKEFDEYKKAVKRFENR